MRKGFRGNSMPWTASTANNLSPSERERSLALREDSLRKLPGTADHGMSRRLCTNRPPAPSGRNSPTPATPKVLEKIWRSSTRARMCSQSGRGRLEKRIFGNSVLSEDCPDQVLSRFALAFRVGLAHETPVSRIDVRARLQSPLCKRHQRAADCQVLLPGHALNLNSQSRRNRRPRLPRRSRSPASSAERARALGTIRTGSQSSHRCQTCSRTAPVRGSNGNSIVPSCRPPRSTRPRRACRAVSGPPSW